MTDLRHLLEDLAESVEASADRAGTVRVRAARVRRHRRWVATTCAAVLTLGIVVGALALGDPARDVVTPVRPQPSSTALVRPEPASPVVPEPGATTSPDDLVYCGGPVKVSRLSEPGGLESEQSPLGDQLRAGLANRYWRGMLRGQTNWLHLGSEPGYVWFGHRTGAVGIDQIIGVELHNGVSVPTSLYACSGIILPGEQQATRIDSYRVAGQELTLRWSAGTCGGEVRVVSRVELADRPDAVGLRLVTTHDPAVPPPSPGLACAGTGRLMDTVVRLPTPLDGRAVLDTSFVPERVVDPAR